MDDQYLLQYSRHILLPQIDVDGQAALAAAHVVIIGMGGLGSPAAMYLAAAGLGRLTLVDDDVVDLTNLQRQIIHQYESIGQKKVCSARAALLNQSPRVDINIIDRRLDLNELSDLIASAQVVVDCSDNFDTRFMVNEASVTTKTPLVSGAAIRFEGQLAVFDPSKPNSPCYRCLYQSPSGDESCAQSGVLSPVVGVIGSLQALETIRLITPFGQSMVGKIQLYDGLQGGWRVLNLEPDATCPICR